MVMKTFKLSWVALFALMCVLFIGCGGGGGLKVGTVQGPNSMDDGASAQFSITVTGDTGITYLWTCNPATAGVLTDGTTSTATFTAELVDADTTVRIQVTVNSDNYGPEVAYLDITVTDVLPPPLPGAIDSINEASLQNWNDSYGASVVMTDWTYVGVIDDEAERDQIVADLTATDTAWFPVVSTAAPDDITIATIDDFPGLITQNEIDAWQSEVDSLVEVGHYVITIDWTEGTDTYQTTCIADDNTLVYDSMLFGVSGGELRVVSAVTTKCLDYRMWWIWQKDDGWENWTRGYIRANLITVCEDHMPVSCDSDCTASMTLGDAKIKCKTSKVDNCCKLEFNWAWTTSFLKSIKVEADGYSLTIEGSFGSSASGNGSCTYCCP